MDRTSYSAFFLAIVLVGCDRTMPARLSGRVRSNGAPASGVVVPLTPNPSGVSLDPAGRFVATYGRLNTSPFDIPVLLVVPGSGALLLEAGRDFSFEERGDERVGTIDLDVVRATRPQPLAVSCNGSTCTFAIPSGGERCGAWVIAIENGRARDVYTTPRASDAGRLGSAFAFEPGCSGACEVYAIVPCGRGGTDWVSDPIAFGR